MRQREGEDENRLRERTTCAGAVFEREGEKSRQSGW
jgi:hypothetical protein